MRAAGGNWTATFGGSLPTFASPFATGRRCRRRMRADAAAIDDAEGAALLNWFADGAMTLLGYQVEQPYEAPGEALGIFSVPGAPTDKGGRLERHALSRKRRRSAADGQGRAQVDGSPPCPARPGRGADPRGRQVARIGVHAGLWTSEASARPAGRGAGLARPSQTARQGFRLRPKGHSGKALRHAVASLPRDF